MTWSARFVPIPWVQHAGLRVEIDSGAHVDCRAKVNQLHLRVRMCGVGVQNNRPAARASTVLCTSYKCHQTSNNRRH